VYYQIETRDPDGDILTATWDFGDGSPVELNVSSGGDRICTFSQSRNYTGEGSFNISVTVTDGRLGHDVTRNVTVTIQVLDHSPESSFTVDPLTGDSSTDFVFNASSSSDIETPTDDLMVRWDFDNDGTWDTDWSTWKLTNHTFSAPGTYTIVLEVKDASGLTNTTTLDVVVTEAIPEFDGITTAILLLALVLVLCIWRIPSRTR
jgi:PKD repeat protein